ncbi:MAG: hypothetical protein Q9183_001037, partial [Haloplaca sp. 2 TL-2023]
MAYFLPSYFQKRILRYALSRLDLLDANQLNLDNFDIAWGRRSVIELRDVGLIPEKLASLLQLPDQLVVVKARIKTLRITVPADLYSSGIEAEVEGFELHLNADDTGFGNDPNIEPGHKMYGHAFAREHTSAHQRGSIRPKVHDPGGRPARQTSSAKEKEESSDTTLLPTPDDLAKSFLQTEPRDEKARLQAAVAQSQLMSDSMSSNMSDEASAVGVGDNPTLPAFLSGFLKGIGDRFRLSVTDLKVEISLWIEVPSESPVSSAASDRSEKLTLRFVVKKVDYQSVHITKSPIAIDPRGLHSAPAHEPPLWKRQIRLSDIRAMVLSDPSTFSESSRSMHAASPPSPGSTVAASPVQAGQRSQRQRSGSREIPTDADDGSQASSEGRPPSIFGRSDSDNDLPSSQDLDESSYDPHSAISAQSIHHDDMLSDSAHSDEGKTSSEFRSVRGSPVLPRERHAKALNEDPTPARSNEHVSRSERLEHSQSVSESYHFDKSSDSPKSYESPSSQPEDRPSPSGAGLAESRIFSHAEAESMYMSALNDTLPHPGRVKQSIPGAWTSSTLEDESEETPSTGASGNRSQSSDKLHRRMSLDQSILERRLSPGATTPPETTKSAVHLPALETFAGDSNYITSPVEPPLAASPERPESPGPTVQGISTVSRTLMLVDYIVIDIPQVDKADGQPTASPPRPAKKASLPSSGARNPQVRFKDTTVTAGVEGSIFTESLTASKQSVDDLDSKKFESDPSDATAVEIGEVNFKTDMSLARLTTHIIRQISTNYAATPAGRRKSDTARPGSRSETKLNIHKLGWSFFDRVISAPTDEASGTQGQADVEGAFGDSELLLRATIEGIENRSRQVGGSYFSSTTLSRMVFGYATSDILSFDSSLKMRESTRDVLAPAGKDIVLTVFKDSQTSKIELSTLPINVRLDLRRLDETFAWLGGLSSILDLGNSMISTVANLDQKSPTKKKPRKSPRMVHFDDSQSGKASKRNMVQAQNPRKVTARLGGLACTIQGTESSLRLDCTALKAVNRAEGFGLQVDRINLSGPNMDTFVGHSAMSIQLFNVRLEALAAPKEKDLDRLVALLSPSKDKYGVDDGILLNTLLRQRSQGSVVRLKADRCEALIKNFDDLQLLPNLVEELKRLATVTKYLPEDDKIGILTLVLIHEFRCQSDIGRSLGSVVGEVKRVEIAHVTLPSVLFAVSVSDINICRNNTEALVAASPAKSEQSDSIPMLLVRFVGNEMEPTVKIKLQDLCVEYHVPFVSAVMQMTSNHQPEDLLSDVAASIATLTDGQRTRISAASDPRDSAKSPHEASSTSSPPRIDVSIRNSLIGLNPQKSAAKAIILLTETRFTGGMPKDQEATAILDIQKAALLIIDDQRNILQQGFDRESESRSRRASPLQMLEATGYVSVSSISAAKVSLQVMNNQDTSPSSVEVDIKDDLFVLETCADSTQTLQKIFKNLAPPLPPSKDTRYRTEVVPIEDLLSSFSGNAFTPSGEQISSDYEDASLPQETRVFDDDEDPESFDVAGSLYESQTGSVYGDFPDSMLDDDPGSVLVKSATNPNGESALTPGLMEQSQPELQGPPLEFQDDHFGGSTSVGGTAHRWNSKHNTYGLSNEVAVRRSPLRVRVRDVHVIWNLFDGYDWQGTRDTIGKAIADVELKALDRISQRDRRRSQKAEDTDEESVIGDFLFNSIYIGIPANRDPRNLAHEVNHGIEDSATETESTAPSALSGSPSHPSHSSPAKHKKLRLSRSKHHKMAFELKGVSADLVVFPPGSSETQSSIDVRVQDLEIFDHVPTSTWKKFATYMHDAGERESGTSMIHLEILNVRPVADLAASEIILKATVLPLRLHVDQDALDFLTRFFEFKDDKAVTEPTSKSDVPFLQRVEVNSVRLRLDFKPKHVDYAGIRSGHTNEFMNFFILDRADMVLRHVIIYGISGFDRLGKTLNDIWMPDIKRNQLPGVLAGLAPIRSLVNVGGGVRDLVVVPIREYQKDGRIVRSLQKGALAFAKTTTSELVKLGAKLAIGTQTVLTGAEDFLTPPLQHQRQRSHAHGDIGTGWDELEIDEDEKKHISLYADQPVGVVAGLRGAYASLERDLLTAKDAIVAMPGEVMESESAGGAARAVLGRAPTVILRPAVGVSRAVGRTLLGVGGALDPEERRRIEE